MLEVIDNPIPITASIISHNLVLKSIYLNLPNMMHSTICDRCINSQHNLGSGRVVASDTGGRLFESSHR